MKKLEQWFTYKISPNGRHRLCVNDFDTEAEAINFCKAHNWEIKDKNGLIWKLIVEQANA